MKILYQNKPVLIIGGNGKTGRRVTKKLGDLNIPFRVASRSSATVFDWSDDSTWAAALEGAGAAYITYQPDLAVPGAVETVQAFTAAALEQNVSRLVLLSGRGEEEAQRAERVLQQSAAEWTIVRASWFAQNFSESFLMDGIVAGHVAVPEHRAKEPFVDADDIADVVVAALMDPSHIGKLYEVTGPRQMSFAEAVTEIISATGRDITYQQLPAEQYAALAKSHGVPDDMISLVMYLFTTVLDGRNEYVCSGIEEALGRAATDFNTYASSVAASGAWNGQ